MGFIGFSGGLNVRRERKKGVRENLSVWGLTIWKDAAVNSYAGESWG